MDQNTPQEQPNPVNPTPQTEKPKNFLFKKLNNKIAIPLVIMFGLIAIGISGYILYQEIYRDKSTVASVKNNKTTLTIESEPVGIAMMGNPYCDSTKLDKTTTYDCELPDDATETTIIAPETFEKDGKTYTFSTWDGCSESNKDWRVCKVKIEKNESKKIKASYSSANGTNDSNTIDTSIPSEVSIDCKRVASKYIILGPQSFNPSKSAKLIIYNSTKNEYMPIRAQIWTNDSCREISFKDEIKATEWKHYSPILGLGFSTSPPPNPNHSYIAILNSGKGHQIEVIIRDDGIITTYESQLEQKLNILDRGWHLERWTDNKTILIHAMSSNHYPGQDLDPAHWFYYNVEADSFKNDLPPAYAS